MSGGTVALAVGAVILITGCAAKHVSITDYRLIRTGPQPVLAPPVTSTKIRVALPAGHGACGQSQPAVAVRARRNTLELKIDGVALAAAPAESLAGFTANLESTGCIAPGEGATLALRLAQSLPLPLNTDFLLLHPDPRSSLIQPIDANTRLQLVTPLLREGASGELIAVAGPPGDANTHTVTMKVDGLLGVETAWYAVRPRGNAAGYSIAPLYAETNLGGSIERHPLPSGDLLRFPPDAAFFNLVYKSGRTDYTALLIGGRTRAQAKADADIASGEEGCTRIERPYCIAIPKRDAINGMVAVTINRKETTLIWGSTVADALRAAGVRPPERALASLKVLRPWGTGSAPVDFAGDAAILRLILSGGESLSWE